MDKLQARKDRIRWMLAREGGRMPKRALAGLCGSRGSTYSKFNEAVQSLVADGWVDEIWTSGWDTMRRYKVLIVEDQEVPFAPPIYARNPEERRQRVIGILMANGGACPWSKIHTRFDGKNNREKARKALKSLYHAGIIKRFYVKNSVWFAINEEKNPYKAIQL